MIVMLISPFSVGGLYKKKNQSSTDDIQRYAPILCYDYKERYFPVDVHGDDYDVLNNHENYEKNLFPEKPICYYNLVSYDDFKVYEYWFYYAYNDYKYYSLRINDVHEHDFEYVFVWINNDGHPFYLVTSMHLWILRYHYSKDDHPFVYVERGGHGMSLDKNMIDDIPMVFEKPGRIIRWENLVFRDFSDLIARERDDLDENGYYKTNEIAKVRVKAPWLRDIFWNPDNLRRSKEEINHSDNQYRSHIHKNIEVLQGVKKFIPHSSFSISIYHHLGLHRVLRQIDPLEIV